MTFAEPVAASASRRVLRIGAHALAWIDTQIERERGALLPWFTVCVGLGIGVYFALPREPPLLAGAAALAACGALLGWARRARLSMAVLAAAGVAVSLGFLAGEVRARAVAAPILSSPLGAAVVDGMVRERINDGRRTRLLIDVRTIRGLAPEVTPRRVRLSLQGPVAAVPLGSRIIVQARLMPPPQPVAPGAYDFARGAYFQGIGAVGIAFRPPLIVADDTPAGIGERFWLFVEHLRSAIGQRVHGTLSGDTAGVALALLNGDRTAISDGTVTALRASGLQHLLSISGLHMSLVAFGLFGTVRFLLALIEPLALRFPIKKWAAVVALTGSAFYFFLSGQSVPTARSFLMVVIVFLAVLIDRRPFTMRNVALAALALLLLVPETLLNVSFQMSFAAVVALIAAYERKSPGAGPKQKASVGQQARHYLAMIAVSSLIAGLATAPFAAYHFHNFSGYGLPANMLAIPMTGFFVMPAATLALLLMPVGLEALPLKVMGLGVDAILAVAHRVAEWPGAIVLLPSVGRPAFLLVVAGGLWFLLWQARWRWFGTVPLVLGLVLAVLHKPPDIIVDDDASHVAVRGADGRLVLLRGRAGDFTGSSWLERAGDPRAHPLKAVAVNRRRSALICDGLGCVYPLAGGRLLALADRVESLEDDCARADILIARVPVRGRCAKPALVVDRFALWRKGAHEIWLKETPRVRTAQDSRGVRFWSPDKKPQRRERSGGQ